MQRTAAEARLNPLSKHGAKPFRLSREEIRALVESVGGMLVALRRADPADKCEVYRQLGLRLTYKHNQRVVWAEARPTPPVGVVVVSGGGLEPPRPVKGTSTSS